MDYQSMFTFMLEMAGTIAFAASGAMVGAQRGMDIFRGLRSWSGDCSGRRSYQGYYPGNRAAGNVSGSAVYHCGNRDGLYCFCSDVLEAGTAGRREPAGL